MRSRHLAVPALLGTVAALLTLPASASAAPFWKTLPNQGTPMTLEPAIGSDAFGCETRFGFAFGSGDYERFPTGVSSCTAFSTAATPSTGHVIVVPGLVHKVRVRSGPNPAPLKVTIIKHLFQTNPNPPFQITDIICCTGTGRESATFQPTPNAVTEVTVNLPVTTTPSTNGASGHRDYVTVSAVGPGELPIASTGVHNLYQFSQNTTTLFYPKVETGLGGQAKHDYTNYLVLMNYDIIYCDDGSGASGAARAAAETCTGSPLGDTTPKPPGSKPVVAPATVASTSLRLGRSGAVPVKVRCTAPAAQRCKGHVRLYTRARKPRLLGSKRVNVRGGTSATISVGLSRSARRLVPKKSNSVTVQIDLGAAGKKSKNLTLKR